MLKNPSAIWLLPTFSTHTNKITFSCCSFFCLLLGKLNFILSYVFAVSLTTVEIACTGESEEQHPGAQHNEEEEPDSLLSCSAILPYVLRIVFLMSCWRCFSMVMLYLGNYLSCQVETPKVSVNRETKRIRIIHKCKLFQHNLFDITDQNLPPSF